jgi:hypothetical protein
MLKLRILAVIIMGLVLAIGTVAPQNSAAQLSTAATPSVQANFKLSGSDASSDTGKFPRTEAFANTVHITSNPGTDVKYWSKVDSSGSTSSPATLGSINSKTDYANAAVAVRSNGTVYVAWIKQGTGIFLRSKALNADWSGDFTVHRSGSFLSFVDIAVSSTGVIVVAWNESSLYHYRYSTNGGASWSGSNAVTSKTPRGPIRLASGPNGSLVTAYGSNNGHVYAGIWNGSGFDNNDLTPSKASEDFFADPSAAIAPNGKIYLAWRNAPGGLYYSERQSDGSWPVSRLIGGQVYSQVAISADSGNNLHIAWAGEPSGQWDVWYAFKPVGGDWEGPLHVSDSGLFVANPDLGSSINGANAFGHVVYEAFSGGSSSDRYTLLSSAIVPPLSAQPTIENGAAATKKSTVSVSFSSIQGSPKELRWRWNAAPTNTEHDSTGTDGWETYTSPKAIPLPSNPPVCEPLTLYTQVKDGATLEATAKTDTVLFDNAVQAKVDVLNPHLTGLPATFLSVADNATTGASDGDPGYTRDSTAWLRIADGDENGVDDCSGLDSFTVVSGNPPNPVFTNGEFRGKVSLPQTNIANPGSTATINVVIVDGAGNLTPSFSRNIIYDPEDTSGGQGSPNTNGLPVIHSGTATVDPVASIIQTLKLSNDLDVSDNVYGPKEGLSSKREFWGVWIANTTDPNVTADSSSLLWFPVRVPDPDANPLEVKWDIFTGLNLGLSHNQAGKNFYVFVRFLDGAGNPSATALPKITVTLPAGYSFPTVVLSHIEK